MSRCNHGLTYCAYCVEPGTYTLSEMDDLDRPPFPPKPARSWGGEHTVPVMGKDDKPVNIPAAMQYSWTVRGREDAAARIVAWTYARIPKVVKRWGLRQPDSFEREDLAQDAALAFMEYLLTLKESEAKLLVDAMSGPIEKKNPGAYKLAYFTTNVVRTWNRKLSERPDMEPIDELTGLEYGPLEPWAQRGDYLPFMRLLQQARDAEHPTRLQQRMLEVWRIYDPEMQGCITRTEPLTNTERSHLLRLRRALDGDEDTAPEPVEFTEEEQLAGIMSLVAA